MNASKFQMFEIQVFIFNYRRISINQISENPGFLRFNPIAYGSLGFSQLRGGGGGGGASWPTP